MKNLRIPHNPDVYYASGWKSWGDFLGVDTSYKKGRNVVAIRNDFVPRYYPRFEGDWFETEIDAKEFFGDDGQREYVFLRRCVYNARFHKTVGE